MESKSTEIIIELKSAKEKNEFLEKLINKLIKAIVIMSICFSLAIISGIAGFVYYELQFETVVETTETTTTELKAEGEAVLNNYDIDGNQHNDYSMNKGGDW